MGSGSAGGGGGGGGGSGRGGGGGGGGGLGGLGRINVDPTGETTSTIESDDDLLLGGVRGVVTARSRRSYMRRQLCNAALRSAYDLAYELGQDPCARAERLGVPGGSGFVLHVVEVAAAGWVESEPDQRLRDTARNALEDFLLLAVGDDIDTYVGDCGSFAAALRADIVASTAGYFLGRLIWRLVEREIERLPEHDTERLAAVSQQLANEMLELYEEWLVDEEEERRDAWAGLLARLCDGEIDGVAAIDWLLDEVAP